MGKKKLFAVMVVAVIAVVASYNVYQSQNTNALSDLALANVEALARGESGGGNCYWTDMYYNYCEPTTPYMGCPCGSTN